MTETAVAGDSQLRIGRYTVEAKLGEGGMAHTWLCRLYGAKGFSKTYVVKTLKANCRTPHYLTMFADEARIGAKLDHPNIPKVLEFGEASGMPYLVQEFVDGPTLLQVLARQSARRLFDTSLGCQLVAEIAGALYAAWNATDDSGRRLNVVHRDVSPSNILVSRQGVAKLIDFGVARFDDREAQTEAGYVKGKIRYMAPEVLRNSTVSHQSDLYALGVCLYALCTGEPFQHPDQGRSGPDREQEMVEQALARHPLDPELAVILRSCLCSDPAERYASGLLLKGALESWLDTHGGRLGAEEVAIRIAELFPTGPLEWRADELTVALMRSELGSVDASVSKRRLMVPVLVALLLVVLPVGLAASTAAVVWAWSEPSASSAPSGSAPSRSSEPQAAVLDNIGRQISLGRLEEAEVTLAALAAPSDPSERARMEALILQLTIARAARIRDLAVSDPAAALVAASALSAERPGDPVVEALLADLEASAPSPGAEAPRPRPRPTNPEELLPSR